MVNKIIEGIHTNTGKAIFSIIDDSNKCKTHIEWYKTKKQAESALKELEEKEALIKELEKVKNIEIDDVYAPQWHDTKNLPNDFHTIVVRIEDELGFVYGCVGYGVGGKFVDYSKMGEAYELSDFDNWAYLELRDC